MADENETNDPSVEQEAMRVALKRTKGSQAVEFEEDGEHLLLFDGTVWTRYRLSPEARQFLNGEFTTDDLEEVCLPLLAPGAK